MSSIPSTKPIYDVKLDAPSGALVVSVDGATANAVKLAILRALLDRELGDEPVPVVENVPEVKAEEPDWHVEPPTRARSAGRTYKRAGFKVVPEVMEQVFDLLPTGREAAVTHGQLLGWLNAKRDQLGLRPVSTTTLDRALFRLQEMEMLAHEVGICKGRSGAAYGWYMPGNGEKREQFRATIVAGVGLRAGSLQ